MDEARVAGAFAEPVVVQGGGREGGVDGGGGKVGGWRGGLGGLCGVGSVGGKAVRLRHGGRRGGWKLSDCCDVVERARTVFWDVGAGTMSR